MTNEIEITELFFRNGAVMRFTSTAKAYQFMDEYEIGSGEDTEFVFVESDYVGGVTFRVYREMECNEF